MVGRRDENTRSREAVEQLEKAVDDSLQLAVLRSVISGLSDRVELVEENHPAAAASIVEHFAQVGGGLAQIGRNDRVEARFQKVSDVVIVDQMPRNVAGKTLKHELKDNYLANQK